MGKRVLGGAVLLAMVASAAPARAKIEHHLSLAAAAELWLRPEVGGHGVVIINYTMAGLPRGAHFVIDYNTDTLRLAYEKIRFADGRAEAGVQTKAEVLIAGLLTDYYRHGISDPKRGFYASYFSTGGYVKATENPHYLELAFDIKRWFFGRENATAPELILPPEMWVGELRARYTLWLLDPDPSLWEPHRLFPRVRGVAFGLEAGADIRSDSRAWGARDASVFAPADYRNDPSRVVVQARQWFYGGVQVHPRVRLQVAESALWMWNEDDLVRARVGGMNPYVVPLAGAPWASFLAGRLASADLSVHVRAWRELEVGAIADVVAIDDYDRTGVSPKAAVLFGAGAFGDFRYKAWQFDLRAGFSPSVSPTDHAAWSLFGAAGWGWSR
ncbi:MAG TPA: hypothetical protein VFF06_06770 [Polyangia bacterium]|nr:hypothetical protein [Polyangia bacterium]